MPQIHENPGAAATALGADQIRLELAEFAACRRRNQAVMRTAFGISSDDPHAGEKLAALGRRGILAKHGRVYVPLTAGHDPYGAALELTHVNAPLDEVAAHLSIDHGNRCSRHNPANIWPWTSPDFIGRICPEDGPVRVVASAARWLRDFGFAPDGQPSGKWHCWPRSILLAKVDDAALRRFACRLAGSTCRVDVAGSDARHRRIAERLRKFSAVPAPTFVCATHALGEAA